MRPEELHFVVPGPLGQLTGGYVYDAHMVAGLRALDWQVRVGHRHLTRALRLREEPKADGNLRAVEELSGQGDHAIHEVGFDEGFANVAPT